MCLCVSCSSCESAAGSRCCRCLLLCVTVYCLCSKTVENQTILRISSGLCLSKEDESTVAIRIMEVSKNHQNQVRRRSLEPMRLLFALGLTVHSVNGDTLALSAPDRAATVSPVGLDATACGHRRRARALEEGASWARALVSRRSSSRCSRSRACLVVRCRQNKRPAKSEGDEMMQETPSKPKRCRADDSPVLSARRTGLSPRHHMQTSPPMRAESSTADEFDERMPDASSWASMPVRFKSSSESVCLWANAAYTFLHKLQWQRAPGAEAAADGDDDMDAFLSHASATPYQCPVCRESYGATPKHRSDCDLSLLLEQSGACGALVSVCCLAKSLTKWSSLCVDASGSFDSSPQKKKTMSYNQTPLTRATPERASSAAQSLRFALSPAPTAVATSPRQSSVAVAVATAQRSPAAGPPKLSLTQDLLQFSESPSDDAKPAAALASSSLDALAKNLNLNSWEGYSVLSRFMFRCALVPAWFCCVACRSRLTLVHVARA